MTHGGRFINLVDKKTGQHLELNWYPKNDMYYIRYRPGDELDHLGFEVDGVEETYKRLISKGATKAVAPFNDTRWTLAFVKDPDGIWIELLGRRKKK
jgi:catechol 2,3-dioxygenase-like lactoylglutathione lyase family enzyme